MKPSSTQVPPLPLHLSTIGEAKGALMRYKSSQAHVITHSYSNCSLDQTRAFKMAYTLAFVISLLVVASTFSLPISLDVKAVQSSVSEKPLTGKTPVIGAEKYLLSVEEKIQHVRSLTTETVFNVFESVGADHSKRIKRDITKSKVLCPGDMIRYGTKCLTQKE